MRLSQKLMLFVVAAAVVPLSFAGFWLLNQSERELTARLDAEQKAVAAAVAEGTGARLLSAINALGQSAGLIDWRAATPEEAAGGLKLLYGQAPDVAAVLLVDPSRTDLPGAVKGQLGHPAFEVDDAVLSAALPLAALGPYGDKGQVAVGAPQPSPAGPWLPVAVQVTPKGAGAAFVVLAVGLTPLEEWLAGQASGGATVELVDGDKRVAATSVRGAALAALPAGRAAVLTATDGMGRTSDAERAAWAAVPGRLGLTAVVSIPEAVALEPAARLRRSVLLGLGLTALLLAAVAVLFARGVTSRLDKVAAVAGQYASGDLSSRVQVGGQDELADLARTFNAMGTELEAARSRLMRWNDELKQKVEEALADLKAAQAQLLETQKLAAIGQLGAGVAHEINNPLVGILGNAQLLLLDHPKGDPDFDVLAQIETSAKRCRDITQNLLRFSQTRGEVSLRGLDLNAVVKSAMTFEEARNAEAGVAVRLELAEGPLRVDGDPEQLTMVLAQLCQNARNAMKDSPTKELTVSTRVEGDERLFEVADTGRGISKENLERVFEPFFTTKDVWSNIGLGLSVAYRIIEDHDGHFEVHSEPYKGARFTVRLKPEGKAAPKVRVAEKSSTGVGGAGVGVTG